MCSAFGCFSLNSLITVQWNDDLFDIGAKWWIQVLSILNSKVLNLFKHCSELSFCDTLFLDKCTCNIKSIVSLISLQCLLTHHHFCIRRFYYCFWWWEIFVIFFKRLLCVSGIFCHQKSNHQWVYNQTSHKNQRFLLFLLMNGTFNQQKVIISVSTTRFDISYQRVIALSESMDSLVRCICQTTMQTGVFNPLFWKQQENLQYC